MPVSSGGGAPSGPAGGVLAGRYPNPGLITGATASARFVGGTVSGAPVAGTFAVGDFVVDQTGAAWVCTVAGTPGTWSNVSPSGIQTATVPLSSAQILALHTTAVTAVAGVTGSIIVPVGLVTFDYVFGAIPYVDGGGNLILNQPNVGSFVSLPTNGWWTTGASQIRYRSPTTTGFANISTVTGTALTLSQDTANPLAGDGTAVVTFSYRVVAVS